MSHDRGCPCGREPYEYHECRDSTCMKAKKDDEMRIEPRLSKSQYVWEKADGTCVIVEDPIKIVGRDDFTVGEDKFYRLGEEVAVQASIVKVGKAYR